MKSHLKKAVFFDRDGVLNETVLINGVSCPPACAKAMKLCVGAKSCVEHLHCLGFLCICVTNQPDYARGTRTRANIDSMNRKVKTLLRLDDLYVCLHDNKDNCQCRKPKPGMLLEAANKWNIDFQQSWMVGDRESDIKAGIAAGCLTILMRPLNSKPMETHAHYICNSLNEVASLVESRDSSK